MSEYKEIKLEIRSRLAIITFNRPKKKNAINERMYYEVTKALNDLSNDKNISITALTGAGDYYCSGTDLNFEMMSDTENFVAKASAMLGDFVNAFINHKKILVGVVNGPAIGLAVTTLGLCDIVYCSDTATFNTPFAMLGMSPEGCSSYLLPRMIGISKAIEMLLFNYKMRAEEAQQTGFVARVYTKEYIKTKIWDQLEKYSKEIPVQSMLHSKALVRHFYRGRMNEAHHMECARLEERWTSDEFINAVIQFATKSKM